MKGGGGYVGGGIQVWEWVWLDNFLGSTCRLVTSHQ
jgi:hypothetical protein